MNPAHLLAFSVFMTALVALEGLAAYLNGDFSVSQMRRHGAPRFLPFVCHGGMWGDLLLVNPILFAVCAKYADRWTPEDYLSPTVWVMWIANVVFHELWARNKQPDSLAWNHSYTLAGIFHFLYMGVALTVIGLFYFRTKGIDPGLLRLVCVFLTLHLIAGGHKVLDLINPAWWGRKITDDLAGSIFIAGLTAAIWWRTYSLIHQN